MMAVFMNEVFRCPVCNSTFFGSTVDQQTGKLIRNCHGIVYKIDHSNNSSLVVKQCSHSWSQENDDKFLVVEFKNTTQKMRSRLKQLYLEMLRDETEGETVSQQ